VLHELTGGDAGLLVVLFPRLAGLDLVHVEDLGGGVRITARTRTALLACRGCGVVSARVHDRYRRRLADLACGGRPVQVVLEACRFRCGNPACPVATFAEQVPGLTSWYQRRSARLRDLLEKVALALAGPGGFPDGRRAGRGRVPVHLDPAGPGAAGSRGRAGHRAGRR
jgi:zinc-finger of transposase IS204/IS1001/IS1096/IS1165